MNLLKTQEISRDFGVSVIGRPHVEHCQRDFVHDRDSSAVNAQIDGLQVTPASVASLDANMGAFLRGIIRQFVFVLFTAPGTNDSAK